MEHEWARTGPDSDVDLLVEAPAETLTCGVIRLERVFGRPIDLPDDGRPGPTLDDDIRREGVPL